MNKSRKLHVGEILFAFDLLLVFVQIDDNQARTELHQSPLHSFGQELIKRN